MVRKGCVDENRILGVGQKLVWKFESGREFECVFWQAKRVDYILAHPKIFIFEEARSIIKFDLSPLTITKARTITNFAGKLAFKLTMC